MTDDGKRKFARVGERRMQGLQKDPFQGACCDTMRYNAMYVIKNEKGLKKKVGRDW
jgi:hypothetical protein